VPTVSAYPADVDSGTEVYKGKGTTVLGAKVKIF
jgi:hypothetical protein